MKKQNLKLKVDSKEHYNDQTSRPILKINMKQISIAILVLLIYSSSFGQPQKLFEVKEILITDTSMFKSESSFKKKDSVFFQDENYIVRTTCSGEWGGAIWFKNKTTGVEYSCGATCPVIVNKIDGKYIVTSSLSHMFGHSEVVEISNPESLAIFKRPKPRRKNGIRVYFIGDVESKSKKGTVTLVDTIGILTIASFPFNGQLFHIITNHEETFIARIENKRFMIIDTISNERIEPKNHKVLITVDGHYIVFFGHEKVNGYLDIYDNKINLIRYK